MVAAMLQRVLIFWAICLWAGASVAAPMPDSEPRLRPDDPGITSAAVETSLRPKMREDRLPTARWGDRGRRAVWTRAAVTALRTHANKLVDFVPRDIDEWCPAYAENDDRLREAFWVGLVSSLARHESTWRPRVVGGGGRWHGLLQILPSTARLYGCRARSGDALLDGPSNLACGLRIMAQTVPRDRVVSAGMRGVAADWGPFHSRAKREDMKAWSRAQAYCKPVPSTRPESRPVPTVMARTDPRMSSVPIISSFGRAPAP